jgi:hypothetical protein
MPGSGGGRFPVSQFVSEVIPDPAKRRSGTGEASLLIDMLKSRQKSEAPRSRLALRLAGMTETELSVAAIEKTGRELPAGFFTQIGSSVAQRSAGLTFSSSPHLSSAVAMKPGMSLFQRSWMEGARFR